MKKLTALFLAFSFIITLASCGTEPEPQIALSSLPEPFVEDDMSSAFEDAVPQEEPEHEIEVESEFLPPDFIFPAEINVSLIKDLTLTYSQLLEKHGALVEAGSWFGAGCTWYAFENGYGNYIWNGENLDWQDTSEHPSRNGTLPKENVICNQIFEIPVQVIFPELTLPATVADIAAIDGIIHVRSCLDQKWLDFQSFFEFWDLTIIIHTLSTTVEVDKNNCYASRWDMDFEYQCSNSAHYCVYNTEKCKPLDFEIADVLIFDENSTVRIFYLHRL